MEIFVSNNVDRDQTPHIMVSALGLLCLRMTLYGFPRKTGLIGFRDNPVSFNRPPNIRNIYGTSLWKMFTTAKLIPNFLFYENIVQS